MVYQKFIHKTPETFFPQCLPCRLCKRKYAVIQSHLPSAFEGHKDRKDFPIINAFLAAYFIFMKEVKTLLIKESRKVIRCLFSKSLQTRKKKAPGLPLKTRGFVLQSKFSRRIPADQHHRKSLPLLPFSFLLLLSFS